MGNPVASLAAALRDVRFAEELFPIAARARAAAAVGQGSGALLAAHAILLMCAHQIEGQPGDEASWRGLQSMLAALASYLEQPRPDLLDRIAYEWRAWSHPEALQ